MTNDTRPPPIKVLDLFSGIGGFSLGLERAGMQTVAFCEVDTFCRRVLEKHWPGTPIHHDVKQLDGRQYAGAIDVICGGYPCQPFSVAGNQRAESDPRHLWPEMLRIIRASRPRWVICENVAGHVNLGFDTVASQLETEGFAVWPFLIPASAVESPQNRERLWIVGYAEHHGLPASTFPRIAAETTERDEEGQEPSCEPAGAGQPVDGGTLGDRGASRLAAAGWLPEPGIRRMADGLPTRLDKSRLQCLGNTIVPRIAELIGQSIIAHERCQFAAAA